MLELTARLISAVLSTCANLNDRVERFNIFQLHRDSGHRSGQLRRGGFTCGKFGVVIIGQISCLRLTHHGEFTNYAKNGK